MSRRQAEGELLPIVEEKLLSISESATRKVKEYLKGEATGLRVKAETDACGCLGYSLELEDEPQSNDIVVEDQGLKIYLDPETAKYVRGSRIDYVDGPKDSGFIIRGAGGCGPECTCGG